MTNDEKLQVVDAYLKGETIEMLDSRGQWKEVCFKQNNPIINNLAVFRVKPDFVEALYETYVKQLKLQGTPPLIFDEFKLVYGVIEPYIKMEASND